MINLKEISLLKSNSFSIDYEEIINNLNKNKSISFPNNFGEDFEKIRKNIITFQDASLFLASILSEFKNNDSFALFLEKMIEFLCSQLLQYESPFILYDKDSLFTSAGDFTLSYNVSDSVIMLLFTIWTSANINFTTSPRKGIEWFFDKARNSTI